MRIGVPKETAANERRVALTPDVVGRLVKSGFEIIVEQGAGTAAYFPDGAYRAVGAVIGDRVTVLNESAIVLQVQPPNPAELPHYREGSVLVAFFQPASELVRQLAQRKLTAFTLVLLPRITRAQPMDVLSSQATVAGYKAVLLAATAAGRTMLHSRFRPETKSWVGKFIGRGPARLSADALALLEVDALGGEMGLVTDATGIQFRMLNTRKGPAVRSPRAQCDKNAYARHMRELLLSTPRLAVVEDTIEDLRVQGNRIRGVTGRSGAFYEARAVVVGFGPAREELEAMAGERVLFTGALEHRHLRHLWPLADVSVTPSVFPEAFGMVAAEAAACGSPPLVARHSGLAAVAEGVEAEYPAEHRGLASFASGNAADLAQKLRRILALPPSEWQELSAATRRAAVERWSWEHVAALLLSRHG